MNADVIVLGLGAMGSAAAWRLAKRGVKVIGIEQFELNHALGSSHGESRIIRQAYFEHSDYVPLLLRTYDLWRELESDVNMTLLHEVGLILAGPADGEAISGALGSARQHGLRIEAMTPAETLGRWPTLRINEDLAVLFEPTAGYLPVERCVGSMLDRAAVCGAALRAGTRVNGWSSDGRTVAVTTDGETFTAASLVITAGPWAAQVCGNAFSMPLEVLRKYVGWFPLRRSTIDGDAARGLPAYYVETGAGAFYGFPSLDGATMKVAEHTGGQPVADPSRVDRTQRAADVVRLAEFVKDHLPVVETSPSRHSVCLYTMTPDRHFLIDRHPRWGNVAFAAGFSGHGFKFAPVVGEALADLVLEQTTKLPIGFLSPGRRDDTFPNVSGSAR